MKKFDVSVFATPFAYEMITKSPNSSEYRQALSKALSLAVSGEIDAHGYGFADCALHLAARRIDNEVTILISEHLIVLNFGDLMKTAIPVPVD